MQNIFLVELLKEGADKAGLNLLINEKVPANDGGISLGQAAMACFAKT